MSDFSKLGNLFVRFVRKIHRLNHFIGTFGGSYRYMFAVLEDYETTRILA